VFDALMISSGAFWSLTYILIIRRGFLDQTYGMPLVALCANISWEFIFSFVHPHGPIQLPVNIVWFFLDLIVLFQLLKYGPREFIDLSKRAFYAMFGLALVTSLCAVLSVTYEFDDWDGVYSAFGQNLLMSVLFIAMLYARRSLRGQSVFIALSKMLGTGLASLAFYLYSPLSEGSVLLSFLYVAILTFDLIYVVAVIRAKGAGYRCPPDSPYGSVSTPRVPAGRERGDEGHRAGADDI
jgi:hypothetical protein